MDVQSLIILAVVGWCGTPWPRRWPIPWPPPPDPNPWVSKVIGVIGGVGGGWAISSFAGIAVNEGYVLATIGAWAGSVLLNEMYGLATGGLKRG